MPGFYLFDPGFPGAERIRSQKPDKIMVNAYRNAKTGLSGNPD